MVKMGEFMFAIKVKKGLVHVLIYPRLLSLRAWGKPVKPPEYRFMI